MTRPDYTELRRLLAEATDAPWKHWDTDGVSWDDPKACGYDSREHHRGPPYYATGPRAKSSSQADADAALIAAMRNALPGLLDAVTAADVLVSTINECPNMTADDVYLIRKFAAKYTQSRSGSK